MPKLDVQLDGDGCWQDLELLQKRGAVLHSDDLAIAYLPGGMASGAPSLTLRVNLPDGRVVLAQTSLALFEGALRAFKARGELLAELAAQAKGSG